MNTKQLELLKTAEQQLVRVFNETDNDIETGKVRIHVHGVLHAPDDDKEYYVRIGENPEGHGSNGIGFVLANISDVHRGASGIITIMLKG